MIKQKLLQILMISMLALSFQGCGGLMLVSTAITGIMTLQELEDEYDGDIQEYVEDKASTTYEYIESKSID